MVATAAFAKAVGWTTNKPDPLKLLIAVSTVYGFTFYIKSKRIIINYSHNYA